MVGPSLGPWAVRYQLQHELHMFCYTAVSQSEVQRVPGYGGVRKLVLSCGFLNIHRTENVLKEIC